MDHLSSELRTLVDAARREADPPPEVGARLWEAIRIHQTASSGSAGAVASSSGAVLKAVVVTLVVGFGLGTAVATRDGEGPGAPSGVPVEQARDPLGSEAPTDVVPEIVITRAASSPAGLRAVVENREPLRPVSPTAGETSPLRPKRAARSVVRHRAPKRDRGPAKGTTTDDLAEESRLLTEAQHALASGDPARALDWVARHARDFPGGQLVELKVAIEIESLCRVGRSRDAERKRKAFLSARSGSPFAARVGRGCPALGRGDSSDGSGSAEH